MGLKAGKHGQSGTNFRDFPENDVFAVRTRISTSSILLLIAVLISNACSPSRFSLLVTGNNTNPAAVNISTGLQTCTALVGGEDTSRGVDLEAYFPEELHIHVGDTVVWKSNSIEIHTVTFPLKSQKPLAFMVTLPNGPAGAMMFNPLSSLCSRPPKWAI